MIEKRTKRSFKGVFWFSILLIYAQDIICEQEVVLRPKQKVITDIGVREITTDLEGVIFKIIEKINYATGEISKHYSVNNKIVSVQKYGYFFNKAKKQNKNKKNAYRAYRESSEQEKSKKLYLVGALKKLDTRATQVATALEKINRAEFLEPFYCFESGTIASCDQLNKIQEKWLQSAQSLLRQDVNSCSLAEVQKMLQVLPKNTIEKISNFYSNSLQCALSNVQDDVLLQKIMELIA